MQDRSPLIYIYGPPMGKTFRRCVKGLIQIGCVYQWQFGQSLPGRGVNDPVDIAPFAAAPATVDEKLKI
jgi:hypothetical protein